MITLRRDGLRGQSWVIFEDVQSATAALNAEQDFVFFGRELKLSYAREKSDRIAKRDGTYVPKAKRRKQEDKKKQALATVAEGNRTSITENNDTPGTEAVPPPPPPSQAGDSSPPSHILLATDMPADVTELVLSLLFRQYDGFVEVRLPRQGVAFIEFDTEPHATLALERLNGFQLTKTNSLKLAYGKA